MASNIPIKYKRFLKRSIPPIDEIITSPTILGQSNGNKGVFHTP